MKIKTLPIPELQGPTVKATLLSGYAWLFVCMGVGTFWGKAQDGFEFKIRIEPNTTYITQMETTSEGVMDFDADTAILEQMKANGVESPLKMKQEMALTIRSKTGERAASGALPATMTYEKITSKINVNGQTIEQPMQLNGMQIKGSYDTDAKFQIDSIIGSTITEALRTTITQTIESMQKQISFPEKKLRIGDSFENEIPMTLPMQGMNPMELLINTTYYLKSVENDIAYFDLEQSLSLKSTQEEVKMDAKGTGAGKCEYSIENNHMVKYESKLPMTLAVDVNTMMRMNMQMNTNTLMRITIE